MVLLSLQRCDRGGVIVITELRQVVLGSLQRYDRGGVIVITEV